MIVVGITGIMGSGKTTVSNLVRKLGFEVIDLDSIARSVMSRDDVKRKVQKAIGEEIEEDECLWREKIGQKVFEDKELLGKLEEIIHPEVLSDMERRINELEKRGHEIIFIDGPLIFEKGLHKRLDVTIVVSADAEKIETRLLRRGMKKEDIVKRTNTQLPLKVKESLADYIIYNNGTLTDLAKETKNVVKDILRRKINDASK